MSRLDKFVNDLKEVAMKYPHDQELARKKIQNTLILSLDSSYAKDFCSQIFELPEYDEILKLAKRLGYKVKRNNSGKHILEYRGVDYVYVNRA